VSKDNEHLPSPRNSGKAWTKDEDEIVIQLMKDGKSLFEIAGELERTPGAVVARVEHHIMLIAQFERFRKIISTGVM
jgi:DNA-binding NarL/FixJ family response regulator